MERINHNIEPLYDRNSRLLILGSFPSVKSREMRFFYGHPQNRFWKVISAVLQEETPTTIEEKRKMLLAHHVALWDTIYSCDIIGSSDSSIKNVVPTDLRTVVEQSKIQHIYCNGRTSGKYFEKYQQKTLGMMAEVLPSTSPANAAFGLEKLTAIWSEALKDSLG